jgi:hypothetical protein
MKRKGTEADGKKLMELESTMVHFMKEWKENRSWTGGKT